MAKANQYHRGGHTFRHTNLTKIPMNQRRHNKDKWKERKVRERKEIQKERIKQKRGSWFKRKFGGKKDE